MDVILHILTIHPIQRLFLLVRSIKRVLQYQNTARNQKLHCFFEECNQSFVSKGEVHPLGNFHEHKSVILLLLLDIHEVLVVKAEVLRKFGLELFTLRHYLYK